MNMHDALRPFSEKQRQMILGTLLGDGCLARSATKRVATSAYRSRHGAKQHEYNTIKYQTLFKFATRPPSIVPNLGYGAFSSIWTTHTSMELGCLRSLLYPNNRKTISREWLNLLTAEGLAWWVMDDGTMAKASYTLNIATHGFTEPEVRMLSDWLQTAFQVFTKVQKIVQKGKTYWYLRLSAAATDQMVKLIKPFVPACMAYKIYLGNRICKICGKTPVRRMYCSPECRKIGTARWWRVWTDAHREQINARSRQYYKIYKIRLRADPVRWANYLSKKRNRRALRAQKAGNLSPSPASSMSANAPSTT